MKRVVEAYNMGEYGDESSIQHHSEQRKPLVSTNLVVNLKITARDIILQPFVYDLNHQEIEEDPCSNSREEFGKPRLDSPRDAARPQPCTRSSRRRSSSST